MKFCSTMIASYKRPRPLMRAVESLLNTAKRPEQIEILVRLSSDDPDAESQLKALLKRGVRVFIGPQLEGYRSLGDYFTMLSELATGSWMNIFDDDMTFQGQHWDEKLRAAPNKSFVVCERYTLGPSQYEVGSCDGSGIAWFVPSRCWMEYGEREIGFPPDTWMKQLLVDRHGWTIHRLPGITLNHQRLYDADKDR